MERSTRFIFAFFAGSALLLVATAVFSMIAVIAESVHTGKPRAAHSPFSGALLADAVATPKPRPIGVEDVMRLIGAAALKHKVPGAVVSSIVAAESNFNSDAVSPSGAIGLMQLMPETARMYGADPKVPDQNIDAGTRYLRVLMNRYQGYPDSLPRVIAAYNVGPALVDKYEGIPPFGDTLNYVGRVLAFVDQFGNELRTVSGRSHLPHLAGATEAAQAFYLVPPGD
jgi:Transglycosylase SLT domain